jgi:DeoR/GlpR family transcriptional regulator of sugar metabolism
MDVQARRSEIVGLLQENGKLEITELSGRFGVSEMTVRRDLETLEREGVLKRVRGGAISATSRSYEPPFAFRTGRNTEEKTRIGLAAAGMVSEGETVILDVGTTALAVARALQERRNITVLTPSLRVAWLLADKPELRLIVTGGIVRPGERSLVGALSERAFENLYCDTFFMGIGGVDELAGFTEFNLDDARVKQQAMGCCRRCLVVADASKLGQVAFARVAAIDEVDALITDSRAEPERLSKLRDAGLEVITA